MNDSPACARDLLSDYTKSISDFLAVLESTMQAQGAERLAVKAPCHDTLLKATHLKCDRATIRRWHEALESFTQTIKAADPKEDLPTLMKRVRPNAYAYGTIIWESVFTPSLDIPQSIKQAAIEAHTTYHLMMSSANESGRYRKKNWDEKSDNLRADLESIRNTWQNASSQLRHPIPQDVQTLLDGVMKKPVELVLYTNSGLANLSHAAKQLESRISGLRNAAAMYELVLTINKTKLPERLAALRQKVDHIQKATACSIEALDEAGKTVSLTAPRKPAATAQDDEAHPAGHTTSVEELIPLNRPILAKYFTAEHKEHFLKTALYPLSRRYPRDHCVQAIMLQLACIESFMAHKGINTLYTTHGTTRGEVTFETIQGHIQQLEKNQDQLIDGPLTPECSSDMKALAYDLKGMKTQLLGLPLQIINKMPSIIKRAEHLVNTRPEVGAADAGPAATQEDAGAFTMAQSRRSTRYYKEPYTPIFAKDFTEGDRQQFLGTILQQYRVATCADAVREIMLCLNCVQAFTERQAVPNHAISTANLQTQIQNLEEWQPHIATGQITEPCKTYLNDLRNYMREITVASAELPSALKSKLSSMQTRITSLMTPGLMRIAHYIPQTADDTKRFMHVSYVVTPYTPMYMRDITPTDRDNFLHQRMHGLRSVSSGDAVRDLFICLSCISGHWQRHDRPETAKMKEQLQNFIGRLEEWQQAIATGDLSEPCHTFILELRQFLDDPQVRQTLPTSLGNKTTTTTSRLHHILTGELAVNHIVAGTGYGGAARA